MSYRKGLYRIGKTSRTLRETNQHLILKAIEQHENFTFEELLELAIVSREPLYRHLNNLIKKHDIEKYFSKTKNRVVYRLTTKGKIPLQIESMIHGLGLLATYTVFAEKGNLEVDFPETLNEAIKSYVKAKSKIPAKTYMEYLKEKYPLEI